MPQNEFATRREISVSLSLSLFFFLFFNPIKKPRQFRNIFFLETRDIHTQRQALQESSR